MNLVLDPMSFRTCGPLSVDASGWLDVCLCPSHSEVL